MGAARRGGEPRKIRGVVRSAMRQAPLAQRAKRERVGRAWAAAAGEEIAAHTSPRDFRRGVLRIGVDSSTLLAELVSFHRERLLEALTENEEGLVVREIRFELAGVREA